MYPLLQVNKSQFKPQQESRNQKLKLKQKKNGLKLIIFVKQDLSSRERLKN